MKIKIKRRDKAVSEIVGTILLLAIAICVFSVVYMNVLSEDGPNPETYATIIGKIEAEDLVFEHRSGETLDLDSKVILTIAGQRQPPRTLRELLDQSSQSDYLWNIGERISFPLQSFGIGPDENVRVAGEIYDEESNSLIFWGVLREGYTVSEFGRGGVWHFNEPIWTGATNEVKDSSGNNNHGTALNGASIIVNDIDVDDDTVDGNCAYFDGIDDHVEVKNAYSLNMTDAITVEAWVKPLQERVKIENKDLGSSFAFNPEIIQVKHNLYAVVGEGQVAQEGVIATINISADGQISNPIDYSEYDTKWGVRPTIFQISSCNEFSIYAIAYQSQKSGAKSGVLKTLKIYTNNGSISDIIDIWNFDINYADVPDIINISENIYAIVYRGLNNNGFLKTVEIANDGQITPELNADPIDEYIFNSTAFGPDIIKISDTNYSIAYRGDNNKGLLQTVHIETNGDIIAKIDEVKFDSVSDEFDSQNSDQKIKIINAYNNYYALVYEKDNDHGVVTTVEIDSNGKISRPVVVNSLDFDGDCTEPDMIFCSNDIYAITYAKKEGKSPGYLITIEITQNGLIIKDSYETILTTISPDDPPESCYSPEIIHINNRVFAIAYRTGKPHRGFLTTVLIGEDPTPRYRRGVVRAGATGIYAEYKKDATMVDLFACINTSANEGVIIERQIPPNIWHHIVLTFDGSIMRLYCDTIELDNKHVNKNIYLSKNNLRFGNIFYGHLDEIAIHDKALTLEEIQIHYNNPGYFENEIK